MSDFLQGCYAGYVNLDKRVDRKIRMEHALRVARVEATRHRGMLPEEYKGSPLQIKAMLDRPQKGAIGCHFSQVGVMKEAERQGKHAFVMEDDLVFCSDFQKRMETLADFDREFAWDIIWLGGTFHIGPAYWHIANSRGCLPLGFDAMLDDAFDRFPNMIRTFGCFCTYAYIVNVESIGKILSSMDRLLPKSIGIDHMMIMLQPELLTYSYVPGMIKQYDHESDIGKGVTKFSNFATLNRICKCPSPSTCTHGKENLARSAYWWADRTEEFDPTKFDWKEAKDQPR